VHDFRSFPRLRRGIKSHGAKQGVENGAKSGQDRPILLRGNAIAAFGEFCVKFGWIQAIIR